METSGTFWELLTLLELFGTFFGTFGTFWKLLELFGFFWNFCIFAPPGGSPRSSSIALDRPPRSSSIVLDRPRSPSITLRPPLTPKISEWRVSFTFVMKTSSFMTIVIKSSKSGAFKIILLKRVTFVVLLRFFVENFQRLHFYGNKLQFRTFS